VNQTGSQLSFHQVFAHDFVAVAQLASAALKIDPVKLNFTVLTQ
jgi:hypothetical protein